MNDEKKEIVNQIIKSKELFIAYNASASYLYIDEDNRSWIFTKKENAKKIVESFKLNNSDIRMGEINPQNKSVILSELHRLGIEEVVVDKGALDAVINRDEIIPPQNFDNISEENIPITNPKIQNSIIKYFQKLNDKNKYEDEEIIKLQESMFKEIVNGKFIVPIKVENKLVSETEGNKVVVKNKSSIKCIASVTNREGDKWLPAFTDWFEFRKVFDVNEWSGNVVDYDEIVLLSNSNSGVVINCAGISVNLNDANKKEIEKYKKKC